MATDLDDDDDDDDDDVCFFLGSAFAEASEITCFVSSTTLKESNRVRIEHHHRHKNKSDTTKVHEYSKRTSWIGGVAGRSRCSAQPTEPRSEGDITVRDNQHGSSPQSAYDRQHPGRRVITSFDNFFSEKQTQHLKQALGSSTSKKHIGRSTHHA